MLNCKLHSDRDAVAGCVSCGNLVCEECDVPIAGKHHCKACIAAAVPAQSGATVMTRPLARIDSAHPQQKLMRSRRDKVLGGVCGGLATYLGFDSAFVRIFTALALLTGLSFFFYVLAWMIIPMEQPEYRTN